LIEIAIKSKGYQSTPSNAINVAGFSASLRVVSVAARLLGLLQVLLVFALALRQRISKALFLLSPVAPLLVICGDTQCFSQPFAFLDLGLETL
jgi:hypothetical protein